MKFTFFKRFINIKYILQYAFTSFFVFMLFSPNLLNEIVLEIEAKDDSTLHEKNNHWKKWISVHLYCNLAGSSAHESNNYSRKKLITKISSWNLCFPNVFILVLWNQTHNSNVEISWWKVTQISIFIRAFKSYLMWWWSSAMWLRHNISSICSLTLLSTFLSLSLPALTVLWCLTNVIKNIELLWHILLPFLHVFFFGQYQIELK